MERPCLETRQESIIADLVINNFTKTQRQTITPRLGFKHFTQTHSGVLTSGLALAQEYTTKRVPEICFWDIRPGTGEQQGQAQTSTQRWVTKRDTVYPQTPIATYF